MTKRRNGKVARLPQAVREIINQMLVDNHAYAEIVERLKELGYAGFNEMNIHNWEIGGYREWFVEQEHLADVSWTNLHLTEEGQSPSAAGLTSMHMASKQLHNVLMDFDPVHLRKRLEQRPEYYFQIMLAYSRLLKNITEFEKMVRADAYRKQKLASTNAPQLQTKEHSVSENDNPTEPPLSGASSISRCQRNGTSADCAFDLR
jgi:hypothetical protein